MALVTGGGTGLGFGAAKRLAATGAFVFIKGPPVGRARISGRLDWGTVWAVQADLSLNEDLLCVDHL